MIMEKSIQRTLLMWYLVLCGIVWGGMGCSHERAVPEDIPFMLPFCQAMLAQLDAEKIIKQNEVLWVLQMSDYNYALDSQQFYDITCSFGNSLIDPGGVMGSVAVTFSLNRPPQTAEQLYEVRYENYADDFDMSTEELASHVSPVTLSNAHAFWHQDAKQLIVAADGRELAVRNWVSARPQRASTRLARILLQYAPLASWHASSETTKQQPTISEFLPQSFMASLNRVPWKSSHLSADFVTLIQRNDKGERFSWQNFQFELTYTAQESSPSAPHEINVEVFHGTLAKPEEVYQEIQTLDGFQSFTSIGGIGKIAVWINRNIWGEGERQELRVFTQNATIRIIGDKEAFSREFGTRLAHDIMNALPDRFR